MKVGKHVEEALRYAYNRADKDVERVTHWFDQCKKDVEEAQTRSLEAMDRKLELRLAMIELGLDPEKEELVEKVLGI